MSVLLDLLFVQSAISVEMVHLLRLSIGRKHVLSRNIRGLTVFTRLKQASAALLFLEPYLVLSQLNTLHARLAFQPKLQLVGEGGALACSARASGVQVAISLGRLWQDVLLSVPLEKRILYFIFLLDGFLQLGLRLLQLELHLVVLLHQLLVLLGQVLYDLRLALHFLVQPIDDAFDDFRVLAASTEVLEQQLQELDILAVLNG
jgi:hypothetical protein